MPRKYSKQSIKSECSEPDGQKKHKNTSTISLLGHKNLPRAQSIERLDNLIGAEKVEEENEKQYPNNVYSRLSQPGKLFVFVFVFLGFGSYPPIPWRNFYTKTPYLLTDPFFHLFLLFPPKKNQQSSCVLYL